MRNLKLDPLRETPLKWVVTISDYINAGFLQENHARQHFERCRNRSADLPQVDIRLWHIEDTEDRAVAMFVQSGSDNLLIDRMFEQEAEPVIHEAHKGPCDASCVGSFDN